MSGHNARSLSPVSHDPTDLDGQAQEEATAQRRAKASRDTEASDLRWLMRTRQGRRVAWRLLEMSGVFRSVFSTNAMQMAFAEGNRNLGNHLLAKLQDAAFSDYLTMLDEAKHARHSTDGRDD